MSCFPTSLGFNFRPADLENPLDCFVMNKVTQAFSASFEGVSAPAYIQWVIAPQTPEPTPPYTFISATSAQRPASVISLTQASPMPGQQGNLFNAQVIVPIDATISDSLDRTYALTGSVALIIQILTPLTYQEMLAAGAPMAMFNLRATSGVFTDECNLTLVIDGAADLAFVCPMLLRVRHEGIASFMKPTGEQMNVLSPDFDLSNFAPIGESVLCRFVPTP